MRPHFRISDGLPDRSFVSDIRIARAEARAKCVVSYFARDKCHIFRFLIRNRAVRRNLLIQKLHKIRRRFGTDIDAEEIRYNESAAV